MKVKISNTLETHPKSWLEKETDVDTNYKVLD